MASIASPRLAPASGASTPTISSRRTSLDTTRTSSPARGGGREGPSGSNVTTPTAPNARRNRAALRDYYNLKAGPASSSSRGASVGAESSSAASTTDASTDGDATAVDSGSSGPSPLDEPGFDAGKYVAGLLDREGLAGVLRAEGALLDEMRELDGARKALVYDNYAKLIAATDTIRGLRTNLEPLAGATHGDDLKAMVTDIADTAAQLATTASDHKEDVRKKVAGTEDGAKSLREENEARRKGKEMVRWVVQSPKRFKTYLDADERAKAEEEWEVVQRLLNKWKGTKGVEEVRQECLEVLKEDESESE